MFYIGNYSYIVPTCYFVFLKRLEDLYKSYLIVDILVARFYKLLNLLF